MKLLTNIISILMFCAGVWYLWTNYNEISSIINRNIYKTAGEIRRNKGDIRKDPSSQEFRDELSNKLYGKENYKDMKDPNMATRIYNDRLNRPSLNSNQQDKKSKTKKK